MHGRGRQPGPCVFGTPLKEERNGCSLEAWLPNKAFKLTRRCWSWGEAWKSALIRGTAAIVWVPAGASASQLNASVRRTRVARVE